MPAVSLFFPANNFFSIVKPYEDIQDSRFSSEHQNLLDFRRGLKMLMLTAKKRATSGIGEVDFSTERKGDLTWRTGYPTINAPASEYVITGPTSGIGRRTAFELARHGTLVLVGRNSRKLDELRQELEHKGRHAVAVVCDVSDIKSVRRAAAEIISLKLPIAGLLNNAGIMQMRPTKNSQGWDMSFATNHLGPFALTEALMPHLPDGANVVFITSAVLSRAGEAQASQDSLISPSRPVPTGKAPHMLVKQVKDSPEEKVYAVIFYRGDEALSGLTDFVIQHNIQDAHFTKSVRPLSASSPL